MSNQLPSYTEKQLNEFVKKEREKTKLLLRKLYSLSEEESNDVFFDSLMILWEDIQSGKFVEKEAKTSTYFNMICINKARETIRAKSKISNIENELSLSILSGEVMSDNIDTLLALDNDEDNIEQKRKILVEQIVKDLPEPCNKILWGVYWDNLKMKTIAELFKYKNENSAKVTKHRCSEKFKIRYEEKVKMLF
jgi:RNA polymerase sigma factor (sigma-70 family)